MDQNQLLKITAICGGVAFLGALLPWWGASAGPISISIAGTDFTVGVFVLLLGLVGGAAALLVALGKTDVLKLAPKQQILIAGGCLALAALLTVIKFFDLRDPTGIGGKGIGIWLCLLGTIGGTVCVFLALKKMGALPSAGSGDGGSGGSGDGGA